MQNMMATKILLKFIATAVLLTLFFVFAATGGLFGFAPHFSQNIIVYAKEAETNEYGFAFGDGSENDPFTIMTATQLDNMRNYLNKANPDYVDDYADNSDGDGNSTHEPEFLPYYFALGAGIDLSAALAPGGELYGDGYGWVPIGSGIIGEDFLSWQINYFHGVFDGRKHTISGLWTNRPETYSAGLFGWTFDITVVNLNIILGEKGITGIFNAGAISGFIGNGDGTNLIKNCSAKGNIKTTSSEFNLHGAGGFAGFSSFLEIENSLFEGTLNGAGKTGGLIGAADWTAAKNCYVKAFINTAERSKSGGIFGYASNFGFSSTFYCRIANCFVDLTCEAGTDPFAGEVIHKFDLGFSYYAEHEYTVLSAGKYYIDNVAALNEQQQKNKSAYKGFDFDKIWGFDKNGNLVLRAFGKAYDPPDPSAPLDLTWLYIAASCALFGAAVITAALMLYRRKKTVIIKETVVKTETIYLEKKSDRIELPDVLSQKEKEIALELLAGTPRAFIAKKHFISDGTVRNHIIHIYRKTGCASQVDFILKYGNAKNPLPQEPEKSV